MNTHVSIGHISLWMERSAYGLSGTAALRCPPITKSQLKKRFLAAVRAFSIIMYKFQFKLTLANLLGVRWCFRCVLSRIIYPIGATSFASTIQKQFQLEKYFVKRVGSVLHK